MASTKEKITATALALFAQRGYDGVSVRDICKQVGIKESSLYYHFPSKQAILTTLLSHFENRAAEGMAQLEQALGDQQGPWGQVSYRMVCQAFFEGYLMDPFCNQVLRLLQMEQFHNPDLGEIYERWMFRVPLAFQGRMFTALVDLGLLHPATGEDLAVAFYGDWMMGTMVDLNALAGQGSMSVDICASNRYIIGQATLSMQGSLLCVSVSFNSQANVTVQSQSVWVVINCADFAAGVQPPSHQPGEWVDVSGAGSALIVLSLRVDYDPAGLPAFYYDLSSSQLQSQLSLWEQNRAGGQSTGGLSGETVDPFAFSEDIGWIDNSGWVDEDGWYDDGSGWVDDGSGWMDDGSGWVDDGSGWSDSGSGWVDNGSGWTDGSGSSGSGWVDNGSGWTDEAAANF